MTDATSASDQADAASRPGLVDETLDRSVIAEFRLASPGRPDFISMLIDQFVEEAASHVGTLRDAAQRHDGQVLRDTAHNLKGSSRTIGARRLASLCAQLENSLDRTAGDDLVPLAAAIDVELTRVRAAFAVELASPHESGSPR